MASLYDILTVDGKQSYRLDKNIIKKEDVPKQVLDVITPENVVDENGMAVVDQKSSEAQEATDENLKDLKKTRASANKPAAGSEPENKDNDEGNKDDGSDEESSDENSETETEPDSEESDGSEDDKEPDDSEKTSKSKSKASAKPSRATSEPVAPFRSTVPQTKPGMGFPRVNGKTVDIFDGKTPHTHLKLVGGITVPLSAESFRSKGDNQIMARLKELGMDPIDFAAIEAEQAAAGARSPAGNVDSLMLDESESEDAAND